MILNSDIIIKIENSAFGGYGIGKHNGKVCFVDFAVPGDLLKVSIYNEHSTYCMAQIDEIIEPSSLRIAPLCPVFGLCGGCSYQNVSYEAELNTKKQLIVEQIKRVAGLDDSIIPDIDTISGNRFKYRSHTRFNSENWQKGFYKKSSNELVKFPDSGCLLLADEINEKISSLTPDDSAKEFRIAMDYCYNTYLYEGDNYKKIIEEYDGGIKYLRSINGFFQANRFLRTNMIEKVVEYSEIKPDNDFLDVCSGCGYFTLPLAKISRNGFGFDINKESIKFALKNARLNNINNIKFYTLSEAEIKPHFYNPKSIIVDPPRSGLSKRGRKTLNTINPEIIVYVSCNPSTFARDLKDFIKNGYTLNKLVFIDMFPCTHHIEIISQIKKSDMSV